VLWRIALENKMEQCKFQFNFEVVEAVEAGESITSFAAIFGLAG